PTSGGPRPDPALLVLTMASYRTRPAAEWADWAPRLVRARAEPRSHPVAPAQARVAWCNPPSAPARPSPVLIPLLPAYCKTIASALSAPAPFAAPIRTRLLAIS